MLALAGAAFSMSESASALDKPRSAGATNSPAAATTLGKRTEVKDSHDKFANTALTKVGRRIADDINKARLLDKTKK
jgi:hypothetical protein